MSFQLGPITLGTVPRIAGIVQRPVPQAELNDLYRAGVSILEFRADAFPGGPDALQSYLPTVDVSRFGLLGTIRVDFPPDAEIVANDTTAPGAAPRVAAFTALLPLVDAIDVEVESPERVQLVALARQAGRGVVLSSHDFTKTPPLTRLQTIVAEANRLNVDVLKLAVFAHNQQDLLDLLQFTRDCRFPNRVMIAMGPWGLLSRVAAPFFGSLISYGFIDQPNAPGQLSVSELHAEFLRYHPDYRAEYETRLAVEIFGTID